MGFLITKNTSNTLRPTLKEETTIVNANYLFEFTNGDNAPVYCIASDSATSQQVDRANKFTIIETGSTTANPLNGEVQLHADDYNLKIYEQVSSTNLDPTGLNCVEKDIVTVKDSTINTDKVYDAGLTTNQTYNES